MENLNNNQSLSEDDPDDNVFPDLWSTDIISDQKESKNLRSIKLNYVAEIIFDEADNEGERPFYYTAEEQELLIQAADLLIQKSDLYTEEFQNDRYPYKSPHYSQIVSGNTTSIVKSLKALLSSKDK